MKKKLSYLLCLMLVAAACTLGNNKRALAAEVTPENANTATNQEGGNKENTPTEGNTPADGSTQTEENKPAEGDQPEENKDTEEDGEEEEPEDGEEEEPEDGEEEEPEDGEEEEPADETAPVIKGVKKLKAYIGDKIEFKKGIKVKDDKDKKPKLKVDISKVDLKKAGTYKVRYIATDEAGNETVVKTTLELKEKLLASPKTEKKMDKLLKRILKKDMTDKQKAEAIFYWIKKNIRYTDYANEEKYKECVDRAFTKYNGDCFIYAAVSQGLLTKAGIENIYIKRAPTDFRHNWNIVKIDGKWSHFDTCPRIGLTEPILFMSDKKLKKISDNLRVFRYAYKYDKKAYPKIK